MLDDAMRRARRLFWTTLLIVAQAIAPAHTLARAGQSGPWSEVCTAAGVQRMSAAAPIEADGLAKAHDHCPGCPMGSPQFGPPPPAIVLWAEAHEHAPVGHPALCVPVAARSRPWARGPPTRDFAA